MKLSTILYLIYQLQSIVFCSVLYVYVLSQSESAPEILQVGISMFLLSIIFLFFFIIIGFGNPKNHPIGLTIGILLPYVYALLQGSQTSFSEIIYEAAFFVQVSVFGAFALLILYAISKRIILPALAQLIFVLPAVCVSYFYIIFLWSPRSILDILLLASGIIFGVVSTLPVLKAESIVR